MAVAAVLAATLGTVPAAAAPLPAASDGGLVVAPPAPAVRASGERASGERASSGGAAAGAAGAAGGGTVAASWADGLLQRSVTVADVMESTSPSAAQRVTRAVATQDLVAQRLKTTITFAAAPTAAASTQVFVWFGVWNGSSCSARSALAVLSRPGGATEGARLSGGKVTGSFAVARSGSGTSITLTSAASSAFRSADLECAWVDVRSADGATSYQRFYPEALTETYKPALKIEGGEPVKGARAGKWATLRLDVRNTGRGPAKNVKISAKGASMTIKKKSRKLGTIDKRSSEYGVVYKVKLKGAKSRKITFTVTADGGYKATKSFTVARKPAPKKYKSLSGRFFWGYQPTTLSSSSGWDVTTMRFLDRRWVYIGDAKGRTPKCRKVTKACKKYSYDARRGVAKIGKQKFKVTTYGFSYRVAKGDDKSVFSPATLAKKGMKIKADLIHQDWSGFCMISCTSWTDRLSLAKNGRFVWAHTSIGSWPGLGSYWSSAPPDKRGTYKVVKKGVVELRYANGKKKRMTIAIDHDVRGKASPAGAGVILGLTNFYFQD